MADRAVAADLPRQHVGILIRAVLTLRERKAEDLTAVLGWKSESSVSDRLNGHVPFRDHELQRIADYLDTTVAVFFLTPEEALNALKSRCSDQAAATLRVLDVEVDQLSFPDPPDLTILNGQPA